MDNSPFGRLSGELRNQIYEYALTFDRVSCVSGRWHKRDSEKGPPLSIQLALTKVCSQMRKETLYMPFTLNDLIVGQAPDISWACCTAGSMFARSCKSILKTATSIPPTLLSDSTIYCLDLQTWIQQIFEGCAMGDSDDLLQVLSSYLHAVIHGAGIDKVVLEVDPNRTLGPCMWCIQPYRTRPRGERGLPPDYYHMQIDIAAANRDDAHETTMGSFRSAREKVESSYKTLTLSFSRATAPSKHQQHLMDRLDSLEEMTGKLINMLPETGSVEKSEPEEAMDGLSLDESRFLHREGVTGQNRARWNKEAGKRAIWSLCSSPWPLGIGRGAHALTQDNDISYFTEYHH